MGERKKTTQQSTSSYSVMKQHRGKNLEKCSPSRNECLFFFLSLMLYGWHSSTQLVSTKSLTAFLTARMYSSVGVMYSSYFTLIFAAQLSVIYLYIYCAGELLRFLLSAEESRLTGVGGCCCV